MHDHYVEPRPLDVEVYFEVFLVLRDVLLRKIGIKVEPRDFGGRVDIACNVLLDRS